MPMPMQAQGEFDVEMQGSTALDEAEGAALGRVTIAKTFRGDLAGTSSAELLTVMDVGGQPAAYVAVERVTATLHGRAGSFVLQHTAPGTAGEPIVISVVPNTGTGQLSGLTGRLELTGDTAGGHTYALDYRIE